MVIDFSFSELEAIGRRVRRSKSVIRQQRNEALKAARQRLAKKVEQGFVRSRDPYGNRWAPIRHRPGKPLIDTGRLKRSIRSRTINNVRGGRIRFFDTTEYGRYHQEGTRNITKRAFLPDERGLPDSWAAIIRSELRKRLGDALARGIL